MIRTASRLAIAIAIALLGLPSARAQVQTAVDAKVQAPELGAPQRGSLVGQLASTVFGPADVGRGAFTLPAPLAAPGERGPLLASVFPSYSADAGIGEWGLGWQTSLAITRSRLVGDLDYRTDDLTSPWGRLVSGADGYWYPVGLTQRVRVSWTGDTIVAWLPDGTKQTFGGAARVSNARGTYAWNLTDVETPAGRRTSLSWTANASGRLFLSSVSYGGVGTSWQYRIDLAYELLGRPFVEYRSGAAVALDRRVSRVTVLARHATTGVFQERWHYELGYEAEGYGPAFYLATVQQVFASGERPPAARYAYNLAQDTLPSAPLAPAPKIAEVLLQLGDDAIQPSRSAQLDADEDGASDLEHAYDFRLVRQTEAGFVFEDLGPEPPDVHPYCRPAPSLENAPRTLAQLRGDGSYQVLALTGDGYGWQTVLTVCDRPGSWLGGQTLPGDWTLGPSVKLVDLNRDRRPDLIRVDAGIVTVLPNASGGGDWSFGPARQAALSPVFQPLTSWVHDFNGDGIPDLVAKYSDGLAVWPGKGNLEFEGEAQLFGLYDALGPLSALEEWSLTFVDANKDGLTDVVLTRAADNATALFMNRGAYLDETPVVGFQAVDPWTSQPVIADLRGTGNTEVSYTRFGAGYAVALDAPETGLMRAADDGRGTVLAFSYARAAPVAGQRQRQAVLAQLTVTSSGSDPVTYAYAYAEPRLHRVGRFLLGFDRVTRTDPLVTHTMGFLNEDRYAGVVVSSSRHDANAPGADAFERKVHEEATFQGIPWKRVKEETTGRVDASGATVSETVSYLAYASDFCPQTVRRTSSAGTLTTTKTYAQPARYGPALACVWNDAVEQGAHADASFDFRHETALVRNAAGLVEKVESVTPAGRWTLQTATYRPDGLVETVSSPGKGTTTVAYDATTRLLAKATLPDGVVVEAAARDPLHDGILALRTTRGTIAAQQLFRFDGQERLRSSWDDQGASSELNPVDRYAYDWATASEPAAVYETHLVDAASASARDEVELLTAAGAPVVTASRIPEGWAFGTLSTRSPATGTTRRYVRPSATTSTDPMKLGYAALLTGASEVGSDVRSELLGQATDERTTLHSGVERRMTRSVALSGGLERVVATENGTFSTSTWKDAGGQVVAYDDEANIRYTFARDVLGRVRSVTLPDGKIHRARYDGHGRVWRVERDGVASVEWSFDAVTGLPTAKKFFTHAQYTAAPNALVRTISYAYDAIGRARAETHVLAATGASKVFTSYWDGATPAAPTARTTVGLLTAVTGDGYTKLFEYRPDGKLARRTVTLGTWRAVETSLGYLEGGVVGSRTVRVRDGAGTLLSTSVQTYGYDANGRMSAVGLNGVTIAKLGYGGNGELASAAFANGDGVTFTYDALTRERIGSAQRTAASSASTAQRFNARGLVDQETFTIGAAAPLARTYGYSSQRFLTASTDAQGSLGYGWDGFGRPTSVTRDGITRTFLEAGDTLTTGTVTYAFDGLRRTVSRTDSAAPSQALAIAYGADGQIATATRGGVTFTLEHDEAGQRILKLSGSTPVAAFLDEGYLDATGLSERFQIGGRTVAIVKNGVFTTVATDLRGSVVADTDGAARIASPFGARDVHPSMAAAVDFVERGWDADLGLVRMGVRDYDPDLERFTTPDPLFLEEPARCVDALSECNLFAYARGAPTEYVDAHGTCAATKYGLDCTASARSLDTAMARNIDQNVREGNYGAAAVGVLLRTANLANYAYGLAAQVLVDPGNATYNMVTGFSTGDYDQALHGSVQLLVVFGGARLSGAGAKPGAGEPAPPTRSTLKGGLCFAAGTLVATPDGDRPIEKLRAGDVVYAFDFSSGTTVRRRVLETPRSTTARWVDVEVGGDALRTTREHPFWVESERRWVRAVDLQRGMRIRVDGGHTRVVGAVQVFEAPARETTYNLVVEDVHDYFVGRGHALVHNGYPESPQYPPPTKVGENFQFNFDTSPDYKNSRTAGVRRARVEGAVKPGEVGHHINSVKSHPHLAAEPDNVEGVAREGRAHIEKHGGDFRNPSKGPLRNGNPGCD